MDRDWPSQQEFINGVRDDGSPLPYHSRHLYPPPTKAWTNDPLDFETKDPRTMTADECRYLVKQQEFDDLELVRRTSHEMIQLGMAAARSAPAHNPAGNGRASGEESSQEDHAPSAGVDASTDAPAEDSSDVDTSTTGTVPNCGDSPLSGSPRPDTRGTRLRVPGIPTPRARGAKSDSGTPDLVDVVELIQQGSLHHTEDAPACVNIPGRGRPGYRYVPLSPQAGLVMAERGCKMLLAVTARRAIVANELIELAAGLELKQRFYHDRAVAVVHQTLLYLDKQFESLGLGSWMPFRWPDQWLSFCGVLNRVLAANGLIHGKHADVYRKLLDETPPVMPEGTVWERVEELKTPINIGKCHRNRGASTMSHLKSRLQSEVWAKWDEEAARPYEYINPDPPP